MEKILFTARDLNLGGIEKALVMLTNYISNDGYEVTIVLEQKNGILLNELSNSIKIEEYRPAKSKYKLLQRFKNVCKRIKAIFKYRNKYDVAVSFATYSIPGSFIARIASKKSILWGHADYLSLFNNDETKMKKFFSDVQYDKFSKIVFVAQSAKESFLKVFPEKEECTYYCNNLIDSEKIKDMAQEKIEFKKDSREIIFLNVGRHDENQKKLTRIIEASRRLKEDKYKFKVIFVGEGESTNLYKKLVREYELDDYILFEGAKKNPYPYFNIADCIVLSSDYEGYPVVFLESFILERPIITTKVSDYEDIENGRGIVCEKTVESLYKAMKSFLDNGYNVKSKINIDEKNNIAKAVIRDILN